MFDELKNKLDERAESIEASMLIESVADAPEDDVLDSMEFEEDEKEIEQLVNKIPDKGFTQTSDAKLTDKDLVKAVNKEADPTMDQLLSEL